MKLDVKNVAKKLGRLEATLKKKLESGVLFNEVRRFADGQAKTLRQKAKTSKDAKKVIAFVAQRKKQIEKIAADLPKEVKTMRTYIEGQRKELEENRQRPDQKSPRRQDQRRDPPHRDPHGYHQKSRCSSQVDREKSHP